MLATSIFKMIINNFYTNKLWIGTTPTFQGLSHSVQSKLYPLISEADLTTSINLLRDVDNFWEVRGLSLQDCQGTSSEASCSSLGTRLHVPYSGNFAECGMLWPHPYRLMWHLWSVSYGFIGILYSKRLIHSYSNLCTHKIDTSWWGELHILAKVLLFEYLGDVV